MGDSKFSKNELARMRNNQRRSRARRKEYIQDLEGKYRVCQQLGIKASAEVQVAARGVLDENKRLRALLRERGVSDAEVEAYLNASLDKLPVQNATASLNSIIDRCIPFTGETSESTQNSQSTIQGVASHTAGGDQVPPHRGQDSATPDSTHSNASPMSTKDAYSTNSQVSMLPKESDPNHGSFSYPQHQHNLSSDLLWPFNSQLWPLDAHVYAGPFLSPHNASDMRG